MAKTNKMFSLSEEALAQLESLTTTLDSTATGIVERALAELAAKHLYNAQAETNKFYEFVCSQTQYLENVRDYEPEQFTPEFAQLLNLYHEVWEKIRELPSFWEPKFLEDESGEYIRGEDGELILDPKNQARKLLS